MTCLQCFIAPIETYEEAANETARKRFPVAPLAETSSGDDSDEVSSALCMSE